MPTGNPEFIRHHGIRLSVRSWAKRLGISLQALHQRLEKYPRAVALEPSPKRRKAYGKAMRAALYMYQGEELGVLEIARRAGVSRRTVYNWAEAGKIRRVQGPLSGRYRNER